LTVRELTVAGIGPAMEIIAQAIGGCGMVIARMFDMLALAFWGGIVVYVFWVFAQRNARGRMPPGNPPKISVSLVVILVLLALTASTLGASLMVVDAGEVGVVFNLFAGTQQATLPPGIHVVAPYINQVYRYSTMEQAYTMSILKNEGKIQGDDSLWSPTIEGLQIGIDSTTRFSIDPTKAAMVHNNLRNGYEEILIRPTIRSIVRLQVSQYAVTDVYGSKRGQIQRDIETQIRERFEKEGFLLLSFDIRNINFTEDYKKAIEQKQIAQQQAEQMTFVLQKERLEAERKKVEADGLKSAAIARAEGDAKALSLISEQLAKNPNLVNYRYVEKLSDKIQVMMLPSGAPFILDMKQLTGALAGQ
jgi:prohibitin 2